MVSTIIVIYPNLTIEIGIQQSNRMSIIGEGIAKPTLLLFPIFT